MAPIENDTQQAPDKTRFCPSCRMEISVLATKCRYCGEEVSRPRVEQRELTVRDLGGETIEPYSVSTGVIKALAAFRDGDGAPPHAQAESGDTLKVPPLPELDNRSKLYVQAADITLPSAYRPKPLSPRDWKVSAIIGAGITCLALLLLAAMVWLVFVIIESRKPDGPPPEPPNPALSMLYGGGELLVTLQAAVKHYREYSTTANAELLDDVRMRVESDVMAVLSREPFRGDILKEAERLVNAAYRIDPADKFMDLKNTVSTEIRAYGTLLVGIDMTVKPVSATLRIRDKDLQPEDVQVAEGDVFFDGRFRVENIEEREVQIIDLQRNTRRLVLTRMGGLMSSPM